MFDHVKFGVSDFALSKAFFLNALAPLGVRSLPKASPAMASNFVPIGITCHCACFKPMKNRHTCTAFAASSREQVDAFYHAALNAGGIDNGSC